MQRLRRSGCPVPTGRASRSGDRASRLLQQSDEVGEVGAEQGAEVGNARAATEGAARPGATSSCQRRRARRARSTERRLAVLEQREHIRELGAADGVERSEHGRGHALEAGDHLVGAELGQPGAARRDRRRTRSRALPQRAASCTANRPTPPDGAGHEHAAADDGAEPPQRLQGRDAGDRERGWRRRGRPSRAPRQARVVSTARRSAKAPFHPNVTTRVPAGRPEPSEAGSATTPAASHPRTVQRVAPS